MKDGEEGICHKGGWCKPATMEPDCGTEGKIRKLVLTPIPNYFPKVIFQAHLMSDNFYLYEPKSVLKMIEKCECGKPCKTEDEMEGICDNYGKCSQDIDKPNCTDWWPGKNSNYFYENLLPLISILWRNDLS